MFFKSIVLTALAALAVAVPIPADIKPVDAVGHVGNTEGGKGTLPSVNGGSFSEAGKESKFPRQLDGLTGILGGLTGGGPKNNDPKPALDEATAGVKPTGTKKNAAKATPSASASADSDKFSDGEAKQSPGLKEGLASILGGIGSGI